MKSVKRYYRKAAYSGGGDGGSYNKGRTKTGGTKVVIFRGIYCGFGALMGAPMVPDGGYGAPGH